MKNLLDAADAAVFEVDDVHHAHALVNYLIGAHPATHVVRVARVLAALREHYVNVGRELGPEWKET